MSLAERRQRSGGWKVFPVRSRCYLDTFLMAATSTDLSVFQSRDLLDEGGSVVKTSMIARDSIAAIVRELETLVERSPDATADALVRHGGGIADPRLVAAVLRSGVWPTSGDPAEESAAFASQLLVYARYAERDLRGLCWEFRGDVTMPPAIDGNYELCHHDSYIRSTVRADVAIVRLGSRLVGNYTYGGWDNGEGSLWPWPCVDGDVTGEPLPESPRWRLSLAGCTCIAELLGDARIGLARDQGRTGFDDYLRRAEDTPAGRPFWGLARFLQTFVQRNIVWDSASADSLAALVTRIPDIRIPELDLLARGRVPDITVIRAVEREGARTDAAYLERIRDAWMQRVHTGLDGCWRYEAYHSYTLDTESATITVEQRGASIRGTYRFATSGSRYLALPEFWPKCDGDVLGEDLGDAGPRTADGQVWRWRLSLVGKPCYVRRLEGRKLALCESLDYPMLAITLEPVDPP